MRKFLAVIVTALSLASCRTAAPSLFPADAEGPDTAQKWDAAHGFNFGAAAEPFNNPADPHVPF